ncbi:MAG: GAF domain-containing protein [Anaerolineae bacterium]|nr:GAF domain-containing protein [Anaerolineae bacterium]
MLVRDTLFQPSRSDGELFANTRAVLALPLLVGDALTGVIELQSLTPNAFSPADAELLQPVADLIAVAVVRTEIIAEARKRAQQAERRLAEAEARAARTRRQQTHEAMQSWRQYLQSVGSGQVLQLDLQSMTTLRYEGWTPALDAALEQGAVVKDVSGTANVVAVPIRVGGEVVGAMEFELERLPSEQELGVLSQITDRFGLAAESNRLLFETRRIADREVQVNEIGARLQTATDLEGVLVSAAEGLRDTLGAPRVSVRIGLPARERLHDGGGA